MEYLALVSLPDGQVGKIDSSGRKGKDVRYNPSDGYEHTNDGFISNGSSGCHPAQCDN